MLARAVTNMSDNLLESAVKTAFGGGGFAAVVLLGKWFLGWLSGRVDKQQERVDMKNAEADARWAAYTKRVEERCEALEKEVEECHTARLELEGRVRKLEAVNQGFGEARQFEQRLRALENQLGSTRDE